MCLQNDTGFAAYVFIIQQVQREAQSETSSRTMDTHKYTDETRFRNYFVHRDKLSQIKQGST